jgi:tricorn protease
MRRLALITFLFLPATASAQTRMLRSPSIAGNQIAFAYANNIWIVGRDGGPARRLTSFQGETSNPKLSPDGSQVAFSAMYGGNVDVYVVPSVGGEPKRLTWHPAPDEVQGWSPDGKNILFSSARGGDAPQAVPRFYEIPATGGIEEPLPMPRAYQGKISPDGKRLAYRMNNSWDEERRNYRGGQNRPIWILDFATNNVETPPWTDTKEMEPAWVGDVVYFLSDRDGVSNVWAYDTKTKQLHEATHFTDFDVKTLDAAPDAVVFEQAGYIHLLDPKTDREHIVNITAAGDFPWMMPQWKDVSNRVTSLALSPTGKRAAVEARGEIFTIPAEKGDARNLTNSSASAERDPAWSPDGRYVSYFSDRSGEYKLYIEAQDGIEPPREISLPNPTHYYTPEWSPDGKHIVFSDTKLQLWVVDVASGTAKIIGNDEYMVPERSLNPVWSPDSRWIAYAKRLPSLYRAIFVYDVQTGQTKQLTDGMADANWAAWDASGRYLWFLASTNFALNSGWLDMSSYDRPQTRALYLTVLRKGDPSPVLPESDEERVRMDSAGAPPTRPARPDSTTALRVGADSAADRPDRVPGRAPTVRIDFDGIANRIIAIPNVAERNYTQLRAGPSGTVFFIEPIPPTGTQEPVPGGAFAGAPRGELHRYSLRERKATPFVSNVTQYVVSADGRKLLYRTPGQQSALFLVDADKQPPQPNQGRLTTQLRAYIDPKAEFKQIFDEGWRNQRDYLYVPNLHGTDWPAMKKMYGQLLPYVMHRADLNYLLDQMGAEIAIGHSFVRGGDMPDVPPSLVGQLGADFTIDNGRYRITKIYDAESWNPDLRAPLAGPGIDVHVGDYIIAINGVELRAPDNIYRLLDGTANRQIVLAVNTRPTAEGARKVLVVPVANEQGLRARAWIEHNRHVVDSLSNGQLAYVYLPNTAQGGYTYFNRYYFAQQDRKGAIVDERYNGGGSAADYIIDVLQRTFDGYFNNPVADRYPFTSPAAGIWGPKVMIINEMSGSGGDLMPYMFQHRHVGPLVGKRTWGGLVGTWDTPVFVDGGSMIAPRGGFFDKDGHWAVENVGTSPDIDVENWPKEVIAGHDSQLERAVAEAMKMLKEHPITRLTKEPPPPTWGKRGVVVP